MPTRPRSGRAVRALPMLLASAVTSLCGCEEIPRTYSTAEGQGQEIFNDDFNRTELGPNWHATGSGARIDGGKVVVSELRNHPLWLNVPLPLSYRVELDVWAGSEEGDIKLELGGDGESFDADGGNYRASGYVLIFGGWNNSRSIIARQDEHGRDVVSVDEPKVEPGRRYHFVITRVGEELRWEVDGKLLLEFEDPKPLIGTGHRRMALSGWDAETHFDNLKIVDLESAASAEADGAGG